MFAAETYQYYLLYIGMATFAIFMNTYGVKTMPYLSKAMILFINAGALFIFVTLLARSHPKRTAREVFLTVVNETGWESNGLVFLLSLLPTATAIIGFDAASHMADEMPHPSRSVPQVMIGTVLLCALGGLCMVPVYLFCITKPDNLFNPVGGQVILQLMLDSFNSLPLTMIGALVYICLYIFSCASVTTGSSRVLWSFAKQGPLPFSAWLGSVQPSLELPTNAIIAVVVCSSLLGLLIFGPSTVLTSIIGSGVVCAYISYLIPIICMLFYRGNLRQGKRYFNLGSAGIVINVISILWIIILSTFLLFPTTIPVSGSSMNYAIAVIGAAALIFTMNWLFYARHYYVAPREPLFDTGLHVKTESL